MKICITILIGVLLSLCACRETDTGAPEPNPIPGLKVEDIHIPEGNRQDTFHIPITIAGIRDREVRFSYETRDGTAQAHIDYLPAWGDIVIPAGSADTIWLLPIRIYGNKIAEDDEYFELHLFNVENAVPTDTFITITLLNDDEPHPDYPGYKTPLEYAGMQLVWQDEFDIAFYESKWKVANSGNWFNNELQYYRPENLEVSKGLLTITAKKENFGGHDYTSARIFTQDRFEFRYGRVDIRARMPEGKGIWPALWMLGANRSEIGWPACGEVDIMEMRGSNPSRVCGTLHYQNKDGNHQNTGAQCFAYVSKTFSEVFHVFSLIWDEDGVSWFVNDLKFHQEKFEDLNLGSFPNPFQKEFYLLINCAVGGNYDGDPDATTRFPQKMEIDYVRVFQEEG